MICENLQFNGVNLIYQQLAHKLRYSILGGDLHTGEFLPSAREMAKLLHINPNTVLKSYKMLKQEHLISSSRGSKYVVTQDGDYLQKKKQETVEMLCCSYLSKMFELGFTQSEAIQYLQEYCKKLKCHD